MPEMPGPSLKPGPGDPPPPVWRRFFHAGACSTIPLVGIYASGPLMVVLLSLLSGAALAVEGLRLWAPGLNRYLVSRFRFLLKESEERRITGATYIALSALVAFLVFDKPVAVAAMFFLALGDPAAALVGARVSGPRVFGKSPLGSLAFFGAALAISGVLAAGGRLALRCRRCGRRGHRGPGGAAAPGSRRQRGRPPGQRGRHDPDGAVTPSTPPRRRSPPPRPFASGTIRTGPWSCSGGTRRAPSWRPGRSRPAGL